MPTTSGPARRGISACALGLAIAACGAERPAGDTAAASASEAGRPVPPPPGRAPTALTDTVPLETLIQWNGTEVSQALQSSGLRYAVARAEIQPPGLPRGSALRIDGVEVQVFFFADMAAADAAYRRLDVGRLAPVGDRLEGELRPRALINNNMLAILFGGDATARRRIWRALTPGAEDAAAEEVEP